MIDDSQFDKNKEKFVVDVQNDLLRKALSAGYDVILDNTHLAARAVKTIHTIAKSVGDVKVIHKPFNTPVDECIARNAKREGRACVPEKAIYRMAKSAGLLKGQKLTESEAYYPPRVVSEKVEQDPTKTWSIVCDLDGTLADISWRNPYDAARCEEDLLNEPVAELIKAMYKAGRKIIFVSGRDGMYRPQTIKFIEKHIKIDGEPIPWELHMRQSGDMRKDTIVKKEIYHNHIKDDHYVEFVIDDRPSMVRMWRYELGFMVMQVNDIEF